MPYEHLIAGVFGGLTSTLVLHPLDLLKVRFAVADGQSSLKKNYRDISNAFSTIVKEEGFRGLYKGVAPNCIGAGTAWGLYFLFYNSLKKQMLEYKIGRYEAMSLEERKKHDTFYGIDDQNDSNQQQHPNHQLGLLNHMTAGACAGVLTTAITNPIWVVKTRLCLQYGTPGTTTPSIDPHQQTLPEYKHYSGTWDALKKVWKYEGLPGLYRGFVPGLLGVSHGAIQLAAYEEMKRFYLQKHNLPSDHSLGTTQYLSCALCSKFLAATVTYPYQVIRARLQDQYVNYDGVIDVVKRTWKYESYLGFYKGFSAYVLHVTPNVCIVFFIYEHVVKAFK